MNIHLKNKLEKIFLKSIYTCQDSYIMNVSFDEDNCIDIIHERAISTAVIKDKDKTGIRNLTK